MMKAGGQSMRIQANIFYAGNNGRTGFMRFTGQYTGGPNANPNATGWPTPTSCWATPPRWAAGMSSGTVGPAQDHLRALLPGRLARQQQLTLNLGLRWEYHSPLWKWRTVRPISSLTPALLLAGQDGAPRAVGRLRGDFQPRVGFAWTPGCSGKNTVLRGAYTISRYMEGMGVTAAAAESAVPPEFEAIYDGQI